jgi:hypothetical protein
MNDGTEYRPTAFDYSTVPYQQAAVFIFLAVMLGVLVWQHLRSRGPK